MQDKQDLTFISPGCMVSPRTYVSKNPKEACKTYPLILDQQEFNTSYKVSEAQSGGVYCQKSIWQYKRLLRQTLVQISLTRQAPAES